MNKGNISKFMHIKIKVKVSPLQSYLTLGNGAQLSFLVKGSSIFQGYFLSQVASMTIC